jgi:hypothetical protein
MSQTVLREDGLMVVDSVLPPASFHCLCLEVAEGDYRMVHTQKWDKAWRLWDGNPLRGTSVYFDPDGVFDWKGPTYPTSTSVDLLIDAVRRWSTNYPDIAGVEGVDWVALYLSPWLYPVGSALSQHEDGQRYSGAFTFFAHSHWGVHWGGELLVSRASTVDDGTLMEPSDPNARRDVPWMADDGNLDDSGLATCVSPRPNRLVLIGPDRPHRVTRVDQNAGTRTRASIAGFFLRAP